MHKSSFGIQAQKTSLRITKRFSFKSNKGLTLNPKPQKDN
jgi:hypothetical protein